MGAWHPLLKIDGCICTRGTRANGGPALSSLSSLWHHTAIIIFKNVSILVIILLLLCHYSLITLSAPYYHSFVTLSSLCNLSVITLFFNQIFSHHCRAVILEQIHYIVCCLLYIQWRTSDSAFYEVKCWFSRGHFKSLEYCHTFAHPKTFNT